MRVTYSHEYESDKRVRIAAIGCGGHAQRNVLPALQFAPANLVAVCDLDHARAEACARQFGAQGAYVDHRRMLASVKPDAVVIVTNYDDEGRPPARRRRRGRGSAGVPRRGSWSRSPRRGA